MSNILLVRTQGVPVPEPGWEANADVAPVGMGAPAPQVCEREILLVWGLGRSISPNGPRA